MYQNDFVTAALGDGAAVVSTQPVVSTSRMVASNVDGDSANPAAVPRYTW